MDGVEFNFTRVYEANQAEKGVSLWEALQSWRITGPWLLGGDFNAIRHPRERIREESIDFQATCELLSVFQALNLEDIRTKGGEYTWCNRHEQDNSRVYTKLDRVVGNVDRLFHFPMTKTEVSEAKVSDNSLLLIIFNKRMAVGKKIFRFFIVWTERPEFCNIMHKARAKDIKGNY